LDCVTWVATVLPSRMAKTVTDRSPAGGARGAAIPVTTPGAGRGTRLSATDSRVRVPWLGL